LHLDKKLDKFSEKQFKQSLEKMRAVGIKDIGDLTKLDAETLSTMSVGIGRAKASAVMRIAKSISGAVSFERLDVLMKTKNEWKADRVRWSTGTRAFDLMFGGGIMLGDTYDFYGQGGVGKSQMAMQCLVQMFKRKEEGGLVTDDFIPEAWVLDTEDTFDKFVADNKIPDDGSVDSDKITYKLLMSRLESLCESRNVDFNLVISHIWVSTARDTEGQLDEVNNALTMMVEHPNVRLVVIDSLMKLFRAEEEQGMATKAGRSQRVATFMSKIVQIKSITNAAVIGTNQVYSKLDSSSAFGPEFSDTEPGGGSIHHNLNQRIHMFKFRGVRYAKLEDSVGLPEIKVRYNVNEDGVVDYVAPIKKKKR